MSSKSKRFVSVFDRLGPGNDEPLSSGGGHNRRYSSDKHSSGAEKSSSRHTYPLSPPVQDPTPLRERKSSHSEYEEKKHLHYREGSSRSRRHATPTDHAPGSGEEDRTGERRKTSNDGHKSERTSSKSSRGLLYNKTKLSSPDSPGSDSGGEGTREGGKRRKRDTETQRRSKHGSSAGGSEGLSSSSTKRKHHDRKDKSHEHSSSSLSADGISKSRGSRKELLSPHESGGHKRRKEAEYSESRYMDRKRKHEANDDDLSPYEFKKARVSDSTYRSQSPHKETEKAWSRELSDPENVRGYTEHKRRHDSSVMPKDAPLRKRLRSHSPETPPTSKRVLERAVESPLGASNRKDEQRKVNSRDKTSASHDVVDDPSEAPSVGDTVKKLDWDYLSSYTLRQTAKLDHSKPRSALERFTPGAIFAQVGVSPSLAGLDYYNTIKDLVSDHLRERAVENKRPLPDAVVNDPFEGASFGSVCVSHLKEHQEWSDLFQTNLGPCRRALTASSDYTIRRKLRKAFQSEYLPNAQPPTTWESQHYPTSVALYQSLGKKASGKPAYRLQDSDVGELLVAR